MRKKIKEQILKIRDSGETNMFDVKAVFEIAAEKTSGNYQIFFL